MDLGAAIDFARALGMVDVGRRDQVHDAGAAVFVRRRDEREVYDRVFDRFWRRRGRSLPEGRPDTPTSPDADREEGEPGAADEAAEGRDATMTELATLGVQLAEDAEEGAEIDGETMSPDAYSRGEVLRHRDFDRMTAAELRDAERFVDLLRPRLERRRTRRHELHPHGRRLAARAMFRRNLATGELTEWVWQRQIREPRQLVVLCDISGSMERHSRLLLRFVQALARTNEVRTESFVFGTRLTRVTRLMKDRDRDRALARVADTVTDWAGGTRIGESFRQFNHQWARRTLRQLGRGDRRVGRLGPRRPGARRRRDRAPAPQLPPPRVAQPAGVRAGVPAAGRRDEGRLPVHRRLPAGRNAGPLERLGEVLAGCVAGDGPTRVGRHPRHDRDPVAGARRPRRHAAAPSNRRRWPPTRTTPADPPSAEPARTSPRRTGGPTMQELLDTLEAWRAEATGVSVGRAVVVRTFGSAPRPEGAVLLVTDDGRIAGSVSGGCVEGAAAEEILAARRTGRERVIRYGISDEQAWDVGLACGGTIDVLVSPGRPGGRGRWPRARRARAAATGARSSRRCPRTHRRPRSARTRRGRGARPPCRSSSTTTGASTGRSAMPAADAAAGRGGAGTRWRTASRGPSRSAGASCSWRRTRSGPRLVVVGAVEVARTLVRLAKELGYETVVVDGRAAFATEARFPDVDRLVVGLAGRGGR